MVKDADIAALKRDLTAAESREQKLRAALKASAMRDTAKDNAAAQFSIAPGVKPERFRADELDLHPATLARARARGDLGFIRIGDKVYYSERHISEWLAKCERPAESCLK